MKFLVIGLGSIGLRHAKNLLAMGHKVVGYDTVLMPSFVEAAQELADVEQIDGCIISSPTDCHNKHLHYAMERGWHTLVEKPIADKIDGMLGDSLMFAKRKNLTVMVGNMLRFHPSVILAKKRIKNPISAVFKVLQKNNRPHYLRDGVLLNWGAHEIDLALYLLGPATVKSAFVSEDKATVWLLHENEVPSVIYMDYLTEPERRGFSIEYIDTVAKGPTLFMANLVLDDWNPIYIAEMQAFIDRINGKEALGAMADDGLATLKIIEDAKRMANGKS